MSLAETIKFCMRCGFPMELVEESGRLRPVCARCGLVHYFAPQIAAVAILSRGKPPNEFGGLTNGGDDKFLLVQRGEDPGKGLWGLPGGFVELGETIALALVREILEETGYVIEPGRLVGVWSYFNEVKQMSGIAVVHEAHIAAGELRLASDSVAAEWVSYDEAQRLPLAFESHRQALAQWQGALSAHLRL